MKTIAISIRDKIAINMSDVPYICGNSDFLINFDFDEEWNAYDVKTARFIKDDRKYQDVVFQGNECSVPVLYNTNKVRVGVFAGNLHTSTPAIISANKGILCGNGSPEAPSEDVYAQIMEQMQGFLKEETDPTVPAWAKEPQKPSYSKNEVGLGNVDNVKQYSATNPPPYPVTSVNGKTGAVKLVAADVGARPETWMPTATEVGALPSGTNIPSKTSELANDSGFITKDDIPTSGSGTAVTIVQTTGDSTTAVMSQKAVTEELAGKNPLTHWADAEEVLLFERTVTIANNAYMVMNGEEISFVEGDTCIVVWDGTAYECICKASTYMGYNTLGVGNEAISGSGENTGEPFVIASIEGFGWGVFAITNGEHTFEIYGKTYTYHTIPPEYIGGSKPYYIDLVNIEDAVDMQYVTEATQFEVQNALLAGYQVVVRRAHPTWYLFDFFMMDRRRNNKNLQFYRMNGYHDDRPICEVLVFVPNDTSGGYDIIHREYFLATTSDIRYYTPNPYALTINGTSYDGSKAVSLTIEGGGGDNVPDYVKTEAERVAAVVQARQNENTMTAILSSDYHLPAPGSTYYAQILESITHAGQAMDILRGQLSIDFEAKLGDLIWDNGETQVEALENFQLVHSLVSEGNILDRWEGNGNHDHLQSNATPFTDAQVYANIGIYNKGCIRDPARRVGGYCYKDYEEFKLRVVLLNTSEANDGSFALSSAQVAWLEEVLSVPVEDGWGTLILSHHPLDWGGSNTAVMKKIKAASGILANLHGHVHTFTQDVITGTEIPRLAIPNVCFYRNNEYGENGKAENSEGIEFGTTTTYNKTAKSGNDTSFCILTLDRAAGKLYLDRYGAGIDREDDVPTWGKKGYTNLVPTSQAADSTEPYNGTGYKNGVYLSSSGGDSTDTACVATGYIPYDAWVGGNVLYVKGADVTATSHVRIYGYASKGAAPNNSAVCTGSNLETYFTVETLGDSYYKLTHKNTANAVAYLRLSLVGTGENLIVTVNEPIE